MKAILLAAPLMLGACLAVNPVTALRLSQLDPLSADPAGMAVQMILPEGIGVAEGSARLRLEVRTMGGADLAESVTLVVDAFDVWQVAAADRSRLRSAQAQAAEWEHADPDGTSGSFSVGFEPCQIGDGPSEGARVSVRLQIEAGGPFLPLLSRVPISELYEADDIDQLRPCSAPN